MNASFYRTRARQALKGKWKSMLLITAVVQLLVNGLPLDLIRIYAERALFQPSTIDWIGRSFNLPTALGWLYIALNIVFFLLGFVVSVGIFRAMDALLDGETPRLSVIFSMKGAGKAILVNLLVSGISFAMQLSSASWRQRRSGNRSFDFVPRAAACADLGDAQSLHFELSAGAGAADQAGRAVSQKLCADEGQQVELFLPSFQLHWLDHAAAGLDVLA